MNNSLNEIYSKMGKPLSLKIEITNSCNLKCVHCYARNENRIFLDKNYVFNILKQAKEMGIVFIHITGGECLMHPDFKDIYTYAYELGFKIIILTNGTLLTDDIINMFSSKRPYLIEISVYGLSVKICKSVTDCEYAYRNTIKNIKKLKESKLNILLKYILMNINKDDLIPFMIFSKEFGLKNNIYYNIMPTRNNDKWIDLQIDPFIKEILNFYTLPDYDKKIETNITKSFNECNAGKTFFNINSSGQLYFCDFFNTIAEDVTNLSDAIDNLKIKVEKHVKEAYTKKCNMCIKTTVCDTCVATLANEIKFKDNCHEATYRYNIKKQLNELRDL